MSIKNLLIAGTIAYLIAYSVNAIGQNNPDEVKTMQEVSTGK